MSDLWTKERDPKGRLIRLGGLLLCLFAGLGLVLNLSRPDLEDYAALSHKPGVGWFGAFFLSALSIAGLSWLLVCGLRAAISLKRPGWQLVGAVLISSLLNRGERATKSAADIWTWTAFVLGTCLS